MVMIPISRCSESIEDRTRATSKNPDDIPKDLRVKSHFKWTVEQRNIGYRNIEHIWNTRPIEVGSVPYPLIESESPELLNFKFKHEGKSYNINDFIDHNNVSGLLVIKNDTVVLECYANGNNQHSKWVSFSVTKSIVSMLVGAAVKDGFITSLVTPVSDYIPELKQSEYSQVSILQLMHMASGIKWNENYDYAKNDLNKIIGKDASAMIDYLKSQARVAAAGTRFNYNTAETRLVGLVLRNAIGQDLTTYLSDKIWKPFGMESSANWFTLSENGAESGGCCISATLRDFGRLGLFAMSEHNNKLKGQSVLPQNWMVETIQPSKAANNYGALWWRPNASENKNPKPTEPFAALGIFGQMIWVDPIENLVIVTNSAWPRATGKNKESFYPYTYSFANALTAALRDRKKNPSKLKSYPF
jgi:CubicO group peptidase (beta-lactamase class C family)